MQNGLYLYTIGDCYNNVIRTFTFLGTGRQICNPVQIKGKILLLYHFIRTFVIARLINNEIGGLSSIPETSVFVPTIGRCESPDIITMRLAFGRW
jgi:hypothetical protein